MKRIMMLALAAVLVLGLSTVSFAALLGSVHDLVGVDGITEICAVCHAPHDAGANRAANGPLWNHELSGLTFTMYSSTDPTAEPSPSVPGGNSRLCLGCHDGVTALSAYGGNTPGTTVATTGKVPNLNGTNGDLTGTHPISILYDGTKPGLNTASGVLLGTNALSAVLQNGNIECSTCHDVHNNTEGLESIGTALLRGSNAASALCTACHFK